MTLRERLDEIICDGRCECCEDFDYGTCVNGMTFMELREIMDMTKEETK